jgi:hypothetical protein
MYSFIQQLHIIDFRLSWWLLTAVLFLGHYTVVLGNDTDSSEVLAASIFRVKECRLVGYFVCVCVCVYIYIIFCFFETTMEGGD